MKLSFFKNIPSASFYSLPKEDTLPIKLILNLLMDKIKENKVITLEDIKNARAENGMQKRRNGTGNGWFLDKEGKREWRQAKTKEEWLSSSYCWDSFSIQWFKLNLGAAILKGKILAVPVIQIDEEKIKISEQHHS